MAKINELKVDINKNSIDTMKELADHAERALKAIKELNKVLGNASYVMPDSVIIKNEIYKDGVDDEAINRTFR